MRHYRGETRKERKMKQSELFPIPHFVQLERDVLDQTFKEGYGDKITNQSEDFQKSLPNIKKATKLYWHGKSTEAKKVAGKYDFAARDFLGKFVENMSDRVLPEAEAGIQSQKHEGTRILYRTARDARETSRALNAFDRGEPGEAFAASTHVSPGLTGHNKQFVQKWNSTLRRGGEPIFTTPYPSVAGFYHKYTGKATSDVDKNPPILSPETFAFEVPEDAIIHESSISTRGTDVARSLIYPDTEIIIDSKKIKRAWHVPDKLIVKMSDAARKTDEKLTSGGGMYGFKDKDPELAFASAEAIADLREPPTSLHRPFVEEPIKIGGARAKRGDKVVLAGGVVAKVTGYREAKEHVGRHASESFAELSNLPKGGPVEEWYRDNRLNIPDELILRELKPGERYTSKMKKEDRQKTVHLVREQDQGYADWIKQEIKSDTTEDRKQSLRHRLGEIEERMRGL